MSKEQFLYPQTAAVFDLLEDASRRSAVSRAAVFEDFLHMAVCALSGGQMEAQYLECVKRHTVGEQGKRGCDSIARAFGTLVDAMDATRKDILGDLFQGAITYGEAGQFMTPEEVCAMMARLTIDANQPAPNGERRTVCDPCCGSGRMLLAAADILPSCELIGQDIDLRCVRMTALNLAFRNRYGYVIWGNTLRLEQRLIYRTGFNLQGFIRELRLEDCPAAVQQIATEPAAVPDPIPSGPEEPADSERETKPRSPAPGKQLRFF